ncbi:hypothetical protein [Sphingomonas jaspsi]|uniref:hypothetical protein n=1 Tax=Sphingomonas jaspsi TaxID=392409 RepID=UPI0004B9CE37|nr:hypothetical protein [Sphingomonas jaspsi]
MADLYAPNGRLIDRTLETIPGSCGIREGTVTRKDDGTYDFDYDGTGTDVDWDGQKQVTRDATNGGYVMERVFIDVDGGEWLESQLVLKTGDED